MGAFGAETSLWVPARGFQSETLPILSISTESEMGDKAQAHIHTTLQATHSRGYSIYVLHKGAVLAFFQPGTPLPLPQRRALLVVQGDSAHTRLRAATALPQMIRFAALALPDG